MGRLAQNVLAAHLDIRADVAQDHICSRLCRVSSRLCRFKLGPEFGHFALRRKQDLKLCCCTAIQSVNTSSLLVSA